MFAFTSDGVKYRGFAPAYRVPASKVETVVLVKCEDSIETYALEPGHERIGQQEIIRYLAEQDEAAHINHIILGVYKRS